MGGLPEETAPSDISRVAIDSPLRRAVLQDMLRRHAARTPSHPAVIERTASGGRHELSYRSLDDLANLVAGGWIKRGIAPGSVVAAVDRGSSDFAVAYFAALRCGATFTAFNPSGTTDELGYQIGDARPALLLSGQESAGKLDALRKEGWVLPPTEPMCDIIATARMSGASTIEPVVPTSEQETALLVYTSGTESRPKGVMVTHRAFMVATTFSWVLDGYLRPWDRFLLLAPMYTMAGLGTLTNIVVAGATAILSSDLRVDSVLQTIEEEEVTNTSQTPTFYRRLVLSPEFEARRVSSLQQCHTYGGLAQPGVFESMSAAVPGMTWATYWGQSELSQLGSIGWFRTVEDIPNRDVRWIGRPVPHLDIRVVDEDDRDVEVGELIVRSPAVMAGYLGDAVRTNAALRGGWLRTGDIVGIDEYRNMFFFDRKKDMVKTGGMNVSTLEVEQALHAHPAVLEVAVVGMPDEDWTEMVVAFVVPRQASNVDPEELRHHCRSILTSYKIPKVVHLVDALPRDSQGKVRKRALRAKSGA